MTMTYAQMAEASRLLLDTMARVRVIGSTHAPQALLDAIKACDLQPDALRTLSRLLDREADRLER